MTATPYYQDESVTLYIGDCIEVLPTLNATADVLLTDPPYFRVKDDEWDNQWDKAHDFLAWMGRFLDAAKPLLAPHASVWVFASPAMTSSVERLVGERFRVLNSIRWVKDGGRHSRAELAALRSYLTPWEGIIFAEQYDDTYGDAAKALHREVFAPLGQYIQRERERAGVTRREVAGRLSGYKNTDSANANIFNWELGKNVIGERDYESMRAVLGEGFLLREYADVRREHAKLQREYEELRRPFNIRDRGNSTDVWNYRHVSGYPGKHPCEKPVGMLAHMIEASSKPGQTILDPLRRFGRDTGSRKTNGPTCDRHREGRNILGERGPQAQPRGHGIPGMTTRRYDAAATRRRLDQLWGWAKSGKIADPNDRTVEYYLMDTDAVDEFTDAVQIIIPAQALDAELSAVIERADLFAADIDSVIAWLDDMAGTDPAALRQCLREARTRDVQRRNGDVSW